MNYGDDIICDGLKCGLKYLSHGNKAKWEENNVNTNASLKLHIKCHILWAVSPLDVWPMSLRHLL